MNILEEASLQNSIVHLLYSSNFKLWQTVPILLKNLGVYLGLNTLSGLGKSYLDIQ